MAFRQIPIQRSTNIVSVQFDDVTGDMMIEFYGRNASSGAIYRYSSVTGDVADGFAQQASPGQYFRSRVLNQFPFERIR
jgi:KTSC domain